MRAALSLLLALVQSGCGGGETEFDPGPAAFAQALIRQQVAGNAGAMYDTLHPLHRAVVPRALYLRCERGNRPAGEITSIEVDRVRDEPAAIPGADEAPSSAVSLRVSLRPPEATSPEEVDVTLYIFETDEGRAWALGEEDYAAYAGGNCS